MIKFKLSILGTNAATPAHGRITSTQALELDNDIIIIDCGEACQIRLQEYKIKPSKINVICISHLHGDHIFGLPGLLTSFSNNGRMSDLNIIGPTGIQEYVEDVLRHSNSYLSYKIHFTELIHSDGSEVIYGSKNYHIKAFPLNHRVLAYGYIFEEKLGHFNIKADSIQKYNLSVEEIRLVKSGQNIKRDSGDIQYRDCVKAKPKQRSYAYCSDTQYEPKIIEFIKYCQYLYHETTYDQSLAVLARERKHSTATEAAKIAKAAQVECLITGHYSGRYRHVEILADEARKTFPNVKTGYDGMIINFERIKPLELN